MNCRLFERELHYIINHAEDQYIILDLTFVTLMAKLQHKLPTVKGFIILTDRQHMPRDCKLCNVMCYDDLLEVKLILFAHQTRLLPCSGCALGTPTLRAAFCSVWHIQTCILLAHHGVCFPIAYLRS